MDIVFKSKVDLKMLLPVFIICGLLLIISFISFLWPLALVSIGLFAFVYLASHNIRYYIIGHEMLIRTLGFKNIRFDIRKITTITETNDSWKSPAASLDRLDIKISRYGSVLVSPERKEEFIDVLLKINPEIIVRRKSQNQGQSK